MRKQNLILGALLLAGLFLAYRNWTQDAGPGVAQGAITIWRADVAQVDSISYTFPQGYVRIERRNDPEWGSYLWGTAVAIGTDTANFVPTSDFLVGTEGDRVVYAMANLTATREFGVLDEAQRHEYGLSPDSASTLKVYLRNGVRELTVGAATYGTNDRYAVDVASGKAFVLSNEFIKLIEGGGRFLKERRLHTYVADDVKTATLTSENGTLELVRNIGSYGMGNWSPADAPGSTHPAIHSFMDRLNNLWYDDITKTGRRELMTSVARAEFFGGNGRKIGYLELLRWDGIEGSPLFYLETEVTRVPVEIPFVDIPLALETDLPTLY